MKEEDLFDLALFGITNKDWKEQNPDKKGNIMDHASLAEQITRIGMKTLNKVMINKGADEATRLAQLKTYARINIQNHFKLLAGKDIILDNQKN